MTSDRRTRRIERLLDEAEEAVSSLDWQTVRDRAQAVLAFDPDNADALDLLNGADRALATPTPESPPTSHPAPLAQAPAEPTSFANGRYQVNRFLGEGGKKKVYLAQDTTLDREVAFARSRPKAWMTSPGPASSGRLNPWGGWAPILTSSPFSTWERNGTSPSWSPS